MFPGIDPKVDYAFKRVFGSENNRDVLVDVLNAVLQLGPGREVAEVEILNPFNDKEFADDKLSVVDVKARDSSGRQFVVELQMLARADHRSRVLYYAARLYSSQLVKGEDYDTLRPAYLISFVNSRVIPDSPAFHTRFVLHDPAHGLTFTEDFMVHMIELPKFLAVVGDVAGQLDAWCYFLRHAELLDKDNLPAPLTSLPIRRAMETLSVISEIEREREQYESRRKSELDHRSALAEEARREASLARKEHAYAERLKSLADGLEATAALVMDPVARDALLRERDKYLTERIEILDDAERRRLVKDITAMFRKRRQFDYEFDELITRPVGDLRALHARLANEASQGFP